MSGIEQAIVDVLTDPVWRRGNDVREWPKDEAKAYRELGWEPGRLAAEAVVARKQAKAIMAAIGSTEPANADKDSK